MNGYKQRHDLGPGKHGLLDERSSFRGAVGKSTLTQGLSSGTPDTGHPPMFSGDETWEEIVPDREEEQGEQRDPVDAQLAHLEAGDGAGDSLEDPAGGAPAQAEASPAEEAKALAPASLAALPVQSGPHDEPYEKNGLPLKKYLGAYDAYNVKSIKSNPKDPKRPGPQKTYTVNPDPSDPQAPRQRYRIVGANTANPDAGIVGNGTQVAHADLVPVGAQVALNVSAVRMLPVNGTSLPCVLTWFGVQGSAWMPISSLADDAKEAAEIQRSVNRLAKKWSPKIAPTSKLRRYTFALEGNPIATGEPYDSQHYILGGQSSGRNTVNHYLLRKGEDRQGITRVYYNVCMNLPQHDAPPVASDIAKPGDYFFTPKDPKFKRESSIFRAKKSRSTRVLVWVYGFLGKEQNGTIVADTSRRGWVTMRVLVPAP